MATQQYTKGEKNELSNLMWCAGTLVTLYVVGGLVFSYLERDAELEVYRQNRFMYEQMKDMYEFDKCKDPWFADMEFCQKQQEFSGLLKNFFERSGNEMEDHGRWTPFGAAFFVTTLVSTLGYGNLHPRTPEGMFFTVVFGIVGIPIMGYILSHIGRFVVNVWMPMCPNMDGRRRQYLVLCGLMLLFILTGGICFSHLEPWTFLESCYFSACTLMSVGFGDYLPTSVLSRLFAMVFIMLGLGVAASVIALLQIQMEMKGEHFAKHLNTWYDSVAGECGGQGAIQGDEEAAHAERTALQLEAQREAREARQARSEI